METKNQKFLRLYLWIIVLSQIQLREDRDRNRETLKSVFNTIFSSNLYTTLTREIPGLRRLQTDFQFLTMDHVKARGLDMHLLTFLFSSSRKPHEHATYCKPLRGVMSVTDVQNKCHGSKAQKTSIFILSISLTNYITIHLYPPH